MKKLKILDKYGNLKKVISTYCNCCQSRIRLRLGKNGEYVLNGETCSHYVSHAKSLDDDSIVDVIFK